MTLKNKILFYSLLVLLVLNLGVGFCVYRWESLSRGGTGELFSDLGKLLRAMQLIRQNYVDIDKITTHDLFEGAIEGMSRKLDPFSGYVPAKDADEYTERMNDEYVGIGIMSQVEEGRYRIQKVLPDSPAYQKGLKEGDFIVQVDEKDVTPKTVELVNQWLRGKKGTDVKLRLERPGEKEVLTVTLTRNVIYYPSVPVVHIWKESHLGYIRLNSYTLKAVDDVQKALQKCEEQNVDKVVLDVRGNPGGLVMVAVKICSFFLPTDRLIIRSKGNDDSFDSQEQGEKVDQYSHYLSKDGYKVPETMKLALLVDQDSASASEMTAACLQDYRRAIVVGTKTFGKGSIQTMFSLDDGSILKISVARYLTSNPQRKLVDKNGVMPDVEVTMTPEERKVAIENINADRVNPAQDKQLQKAIELLQKNDGDVRSE